VDEYKQNKKHNTEKLATIGTQDTGRIQTKQKTQHRETNNIATVSVLSIVYFSNGSYLKI
jgi:hypothetical protein